MHSPVGIYLPFSDQVHEKENEYVSVEEFCCTTQGTCLGLPSTGLLLLYNIFYVGLLHLKE